MRHLSITLSGAWNISYPTLFVVLYFATVLVFMFPVISESKKTWWVLTGQWISSRGGLIPAYRHSFSIWQINLQPFISWSLHHGVQEIPTRYMASFTVRKRKFRSLLKCRKESNFPSSSVNAFVIWGGSVCLASLHPTS